MEYLSYITALAKEKGLSIHTDIVRSDLPTITSVNKQFYEQWAGGKKYKEEQLEGGETRVVLSIPAPLAPVKVAVLPLIKKDGLPELAQTIMDELKFDFNCQYDEKDSIGKRYRRQDAIGTPFCVTVDHDSLNDNCVTVRDRDTMKQERVAISELPRIIGERVNLSNLLRRL